MAEEKKRLTAQELLQQQEAREAEARQRAIKERQDEEEKRQRELDDECRQVAAHLKSTWYDLVDQASKRDGIRFVVLAEVVGSGTNFVSDLFDDIKKYGFKAELTSGLLQDQATSHRTQGRPTPPMVLQMGEVSDGHVRGWCPAPLKQLGRNGHNQKLIVRW